MNKNKYLRKIKAVFTHNVGLKFLAVLFAIGIWFTVVNVDDPTQTKSYTVAVQVENADVLEDTGEYYTVDDSSSTVTFRVSAKRSVLEKLASTDFTAVADMNYLDRENSRIPIEITANRYSSQVTVSSKSFYLYVTLGTTGESSFVITGETTGTPADGYAVGSITVSPNVISISGPEEDVAVIESVRAICSVEGIGTDITQSVVPTLYDSDGNEVDSSGLTLSVSAVEMTVTMLNVKSVDIQVETSGTLGEGLTLGSVTTDPSSITLMGDASVLNDLTEITIPSSVIDLSKITSDFTTTVDVADYLPDGVAVVEGGSTKVTVTVTVDSQKTSTFTVSTENLTITGLSTGLAGTFADETVSVRITGSSEAVEALSASDITGTVDATDLGEGTHTVSVTFELDEGLSASSVTTTLEITDSSSSGSASSETDSDE